MYATYLIFVRQCNNFYFQLAEFISAWVLEEIPVLESLIKITNIKDATEAFKAGHKVLEQGIFALLLFLLLLLTLR